MLAELAVHFETHPPDDSSALMKLDFFAIEDLASTSASGTVEFNTSAPVQIQNVQRIGGVGLPDPDFRSSRATVAVPVIAAVRDFDAIASAPNSLVRSFKPLHTYYEARSRAVRSSLQVTLADAVRWRRRLDVQGLRKIHCYPFDGASLHAPIMFPHAAALRAIEMKVPDGFDGALGH